MKIDTRTRKMAAGRQAYLLLVWIVLLAATLARPAAGQDYQPGDSAIDLSNKLMMSDAFRILPIHGEKKTQLRRRPGGRSRTSIVVIAPTLQ